MRFAHLLPFTVANHLPYVETVCRYCRDGTQSVAVFKKGLATIKSLCAKVADLSLINLQRKKVRGATVLLLVHRMLFSAAQ